MEYNRLVQKKEKLAGIYDRLSKAALKSFERSFDVEYAHNSTAIEGNTLTLIQTKALLEDGVSEAASSFGRSMRSSTIKRPLPMSGIVQRIRNCWMKASSRTFMLCLWKIFC